MNFQVQIYLSNFVILSCLIELALINDQPRKATVVARGSVRLAALRRDAFVRLLGPVMDIFRRNAAEYNMQQHVSPQTGSGDEGELATTRRRRGYSGAGGVDV